MSRVTKTAAPVAHDPMAAMAAQLAALQAENAALRAGGRSARTAGYVVKAVPVAKPGKLPGRYLGERVIEGVSTPLSFYVGANGKASLSGIGAQPFGLWGEEREAFLRYAESGQLRADLTRADVSAAIAPRYVRS